MAAIRQPALTVVVAVAGLALALGACTLRGASSRGVELEAAPAAGTLAEPSAGSQPARAAGSQPAGEAGTFDRPAGARQAPPGFEVGGLPDQPSVTGGSPPVRLTVPAIGVETPLVRLGLEPDRTMEVPDDFGRAGWFAEGPAPGQPGPAVIAGHVDSTTGPAVFFRLRDLRSGDHIDVTRADGTRLRFVVEATRSFPKTSFPTGAVFGPTPAAELRLVTCTGTFDRARGSYRDNLVVFARLEPRPGRRA
jgi:sortase (surface protein transpeptidase)